MVTLKNAGIIAVGFGLPFYAVYKFYDQIRMTWLRLAEEKGAEYKDGSAMLNTILSVLGLVGITMGVSSIILPQIADFGKESGEPVEWMDIE